MRHTGGLVFPDIEPHIQKVHMQPTYIILFTSNKNEEHKTWLYLSLNSSFSFQFSWHNWYFGILFKVYGYSLRSGTNICFGIWCLNTASWPNYLLLSFLNLFCEISRPRNQRSKVWLCILELRVPSNIFLSPSAEADSINRLISNPMVLQFSCTIHL